MTKKHFEMIAKVMKNSRLVENEEGARAIFYVVQRLADEFMIENNRFDVEKFMAACGCTAATAGKR